jgi:hypothetical protein
MNLIRFAGLCWLCALLPVAVAHAADSAPAEELNTLAPSRLLLNADGLHDHWNGIGRIASTRGLHCTATLIDTRSPDSPTAAAAYVLTSGHCINRELGVMLADEEIEGTVQFNYFADTTPRSYPLKRVVWSSMQGVDLAIVELEPTLQSLVDDGIQPLRLADTMPAPGRDILWVGAPLYKDTGHLRMAACSHEPSGEILSPPWVWRRSVSNRCKDIDTGASGSPLLIRDSGEVYAVVNLITLSAVSGSADSAPPGFPPLAHGSNFAMAVTHLHPCFVDGLFNPDPAECHLFPTFSIRFDPVQGRPKQFAKVRIGEDGTEIYPRWGLSFTASVPFYRYKTTDSAPDCESPIGYGNVEAAQNATIDALVNTRIGINWLCIIGLPSADERPSLGLMRNALALAMELQPAGPTAEPHVTIEATRFKTYSVRWALDTGMIDYYTVKIGPPETTDCSDPEGFRRRFGDLVLRARSLPKKICTYAHDVNGQPSQLREDIVTGAMETSAQQG